MLKYLSHNFNYFRCNLRGIDSGGDTCIYVFAIFYIILEKLRVRVVYSCSRWANLSI